MAHSFSDLGAHSALLGALADKNPKAVESLVRVVVRATNLLKEDPKRAASFVGAAFGKIVTDLVEGIIMPPIGLVLNRVDFQSLFLVLDYSKGTPASLAEAKTKGIPVIAYGQLFNDLLSFLIIGLVVFLIVREANKIKNAVEHPAPGAPTR